ncbi:MAG TPA: VWA domain-containing protein [Myxococcales bacterium]|nr:VWA domain-containing protein [Myxococcales bacterium]
MHLQLLTVLIPLALAQFITSVSANEPKSQVKKGTVTMTVSLNNQNLLMPGKGRVHLAVDLKATNKAPNKRLPMNLALVIDRSGSMRGEKIEKTREAARHLIKQLSDKDRIAIVSYSDHVRVDLPSQLATEEIKKQALDAISRIHAGGSTNLSGGLFRGQSEVQKSMASGQINRVIVMSDGLANRGIVDTKALAQHTQKSAQRGVSVSTMGVGTDYNEDLMTAVADHGSGNYYFIKESSAIAAVFSQELKKMFSTVAQNASVELLLDDGVDLKQVFGYTFRREGEKVIIPLAELFAGQKRSILIELQVPVLRVGNVAVGQAKFRYNDVIANGKETLAEANLNVNVTKDKTLVERTRNRSVEERIGEVEVASAMNTAANLVKEGRFGEAKNVIRRQRSMTMSQSRAMGGSKRLKKQAKELDELEALFDKAKAAPASAPAAIKATKSKGYRLKK